nr:14561_t:CDS:2 [Entrophospora candida]
MPRIGENSVNSTIDSIASRTRTELKSRLLRIFKTYTTATITTTTPSTSNRRKSQSQVIMDVDTVESSKLVATTTTTTTPSTPDKRKSKSQVMLIVSDRKKDAIVSNSIDETIFKRMNPILHSSIIEPGFKKPKMTIWKLAKFNAASQTTLEIYSHTPDVSDGIKKRLL